MEIEPKKHLELVKLTYHELNPDKFPNNGGGLIPMEISLEELSRRAEQIGYDILDSPLPKWLVEEIYPNVKWIVVTRAGDANALMFLHQTRGMLWVRNEDFDRFNTMFTA